MKNFYMALLGFIFMLLASPFAFAESDKSVALAGLFDTWGDNIVKLRNERLGDSLAFSDPEEPDKESLYWVVKTEEDVNTVHRYIDLYYLQLYKPVRFPDIDPLQEATPMHIAALFNDNPEVLQAMVDGGGDVNVIENDNTATPLHSALYANRPLAIIRKLVELGANVNAKLDGGDYSGMTPLHLAAAKSSHSEVIAYLVEKGADVHATFKFGFFNVTPLDALKHKGYDNIKQDSEVLALLEE